MVMIYVQITRFEPVHVEQISPHLPRPTPTCESEGGTWHPVDRYDPPIDGWTDAFRATWTQPCPGFWERTHNHAECDHPDVGACEADEDDGSGAFARRYTIIERELIIN